MWKGWHKLLWLFDRLGAEWRRWKFQTAMRLEASDPPWSVAPASIEPHLSFPGQLSVILRSWWVVEAFQFNHGLPLHTLPRWPRDSPRCPAQSWRTGSCSGSAPQREACKADQVNTAVVVWCTCQAVSGNRLLEVRWCRAVGACRASNTEIVRRAKHPTLVGRRPYRSAPSWHEP